MWILKNLLATPDCPPKRPFWFVPSTVVRVYLLLFLRTPASNPFYILCQSRVKKWGLIIILVCFPLMACEAVQFFTLAICLSSVNYLPLPAYSRHLRVCRVHFSCTFICMSSFSPQTNSATREKEYYHASFMDKGTRHLEPTRKHLTCTKASACSVWSWLDLTSPVTCWRKAAQDRGKGQAQGSKHPSLVPARPQTSLWCLPTRQLFVSPAAHWSRRTNSASLPGLCVRSLWEPLKLPVPQHYPKSIKSSLWGGETWIHPCLLMFPWLLRNEAKVENIVSKLNDPLDFSIHCKLPSENSL